MMRSMPRNVCVPIIIASLIAATTIEYRSESQTAQSYIVQANGLDQAMALVGEVEGEITHDLDIIDAVGARLTPSQVAKLLPRETNPKTPYCW